MEYKKCSVLRDGNVTTSGSSNRELATNGDSVDGITLLKRHLATVTAERDELASDIVLHLEAAERAAKANGEEAEVMHYGAGTTLTTACALNSRPDMQTSTDWSEVTCAGCQKNRAGAAEARAKVMRESLEVICALVMKYDIPAAWEAREIAQDALKEATND